MSERPFHGKQHAHREQIRIVAIAAIDAARPIGICDTLILSVIRDVPIQCSQTDLRRELRALKKKSVIEIERIEGGAWLVWFVGHRGRNRLAAVRHNALGAIFRGEELSTPQPSPLHGS